MKGSLKRKEFVMCVQLDLFRAPAWCAIRLARAGLRAQLARVTRDNYTVYRQSPVAFAKAWWTDR